uniref:PWWP domain-containing protein n=1 Tax=Davidia involucrata TaxID=16924 RepID=A0A5B7A3M9_DAVIN
MAKKWPNRKKREKVHGIDHIPKYSQQPRSPGYPKRRTDFSLFFCSSFFPLSNAPFGQGLMLESSSSKDILSSVTIASLDETRDKRKEILELPLVQCSMSQDKTQGLSSNFVEVPLIEVESVAQNASTEPSSDRNLGNQECDIVRKFKFTPDKSQVTEGDDVCTTPGSVVWAKTAHQLWWPAKILRGRSTMVDSRNQGINRHVLVQYYGDHGCAWVDPARDLSQFEDCFEERSRNPMEEFQDALKQALHAKEHRISGRKLIGSSSGPTFSNLPDLSPEKWNSSSSSRTESDCLERGRGKRERKPKVRFDEVTFPLKSARKVRRFRIMRFLGLAAPVGSPFSVTPHDIQKVYV